METHASCAEPRCPRRNAHLNTTDNRRILNSKMTMINIDGNRPVCWRPVDSYSGKF